MVYVTGDTHGDFSRFRSSGARRLRRGDTLIVLGDFGFLWDGGKKEQRLLKKLARLKYTVLFLDGAHENYDLLQPYPVTEWNGGKVQVIEDSVIHLLRGEIYEIEGASYFTFGGGQSPDQDLRQPGLGGEETLPGAEEMLNGLGNLEKRGNKVDFILTHEFPGQAGLFPQMKGTKINGLNAYLGNIESIVEYRRWFFGSLHLDRPVSRRMQAVFQQILPVEPSTHTSPK